MANYTFPSTLLDSDNDYPYMTITILDPTKKSSSSDQIALYIPPGIQFQDGGSYSSMNLGAIGAAVLNGGLSDPMSFAKSAFKSSMDAVKRTYMNGSDQIVGSVLAAAAANFVPGASFSSAKDVFEFSNKKILNPHSNTAFQGSNIRAYQFAFKFMPESKEESAMAIYALRLLRENMYPQEANQLITHYPSKFEIRFWTGYGSDGSNSGVSESDSIPKIYQCYLTSLSVSYNQTASMFFEDGAPMEIDVSMSFQETRALSRNDIKALEQDKIRSFAGRDAETKKRRDERIISGGAG